MKLKRADMEWLLATFREGKGPIHWNEESKQEGQGLDVRGANLSEEDLSNLPLAYMQGGLTEDE